MSLRFKQTFTPSLGIRLNISKRRIGTSIGVPGATVSAGEEEVGVTAGLSGTGLSYITLTPPYDNRRSAISPLSPASTEPHLGMPEASLSNTPSNVKIYMPMADMNEVPSVSVEVLTSTSPLSLRDSIARAREQGAEIKADLQEALAEELKQKSELVRRKSNLFRWSYKRHIAELETVLLPTQVEISRSISWEDNTKITITLESSDTPQCAYVAMVRAFDMLKSSIKKWDITADKTTDQFAERTLAAHSVDRHLVTFDSSSTDLIQFTGCAMRFENVNGDDILLYPGVAVIPRTDRAFVLIDLRELQVSSGYRRFHEEKGAPSDSSIDGYIWTKMNKSGSPDCRFKDNYQIPICIYGDITLHFQTGATEEYMVPNADATWAFAEAVKHYQASPIETEVLIQT